MTNSTLIRSRCFEQPPGVSRYVHGIVPQRLAKDDPESTLQGFKMTLV